jgi:hypothetical protein
MRSRLPSYWFLVGMAVVMVLGHICAQPFHAHAGTITTHGERDSHHGGGESDEDATHAASCDAAKSAPTGMDGAVLAPIGTIVTAAPIPIRRVTEANAATATGSPPLFLLHASLLI